MKKLILLVLFICGNIIFSYPSKKERNEFLTSKSEVYISNQKQWFYGEGPGLEEGEWTKLYTFINVIKIGDKYKISYSPIDNIKEFDKSGFPVLKYEYRVPSASISKSKTKKKIPYPTSYEHDYAAHYAGLITTGTEIKNGKKYERQSYQILSEKEFDAFLKEKKAKKLDDDTSKKIKEYLNWLINDFIWP